MKKLAIFLAVFFLLPKHAFAAAMVFGAHSQTVPPEKPLEIGVFVNTEGEAVNAVAGDVVLPDFVSDVSIRDQGSLVSLWLKRPEVQHGRIHFEGVIPGGVTSTALPLFSILVTPSSAGTLSVHTEHEEIYKNDGLGTLLPVKSGSIQLTVAESAQETPVPSADVHAPESFVPQIVLDAQVENGKPAVIFATSDTESGIDHYEVQERAFFLGGTWVRAESPYILKRASLFGDHVAVRAIDRAGNVREESVRIPLERSAIVIILSCILVLIATILLFVKRLWRKPKQGKSR